MTVYPRLNRPRVRASRVAWLLAAALTVAACATGSKAQAKEGGSLLDQIKAAGVVKVGTRVDNPPHSFYDAAGAWVGFDNDIAAAVAKRLGVKLELVKVDELTRISYLQNGKIDLAIASISKTKKRGEQVDFSETYFFSTQTFVVRKGQVASYKDLVGKRVGASRGSSSIGNWKAWLTKNGFPGEPDIEQFGDKHAALEAVKQGAIAGWTEDYEVLASYARNEPTLEVLNVPGGTGVKLDGIAMRKNDSTLRNAVNLALQDIAASGEYDKTYDHWFGASSTAPVPRQGQIEVWPNG
jgi:polar amino acid transport system substrate-binding protein